MYLGISSPETSVTHPLTRGFKQLGQIQCFNWECSYNRAAVLCGWYIDHKTTCPTRSAFSVHRYDPGKDGNRAPVPVHSHSFQVHSPEIHSRREADTERPPLQECWSHVSSPARGSFLFPCTAVAAAGLLGFTSTAVSMLTSGSQTGFLFWEGWF